MKDMPKDYNCLEQIKSAIYFNNTRGKIGRKEKDLEVDELLTKYFNNCDFASIESDITTIVFTETTTTLIQAIESYRYSQFMSSMVMVRNAIDAATYASITLEPVYTHNLNKVISIHHIGGITGYKQYKKWDKRANQIISKGFEIDELSKIRNEGNFFAHYFVLKRKNLNNIIQISNI